MIYALKGSELYYYTPVGSDPIYFYDVYDFVRMNRIESLLKKTTMQIMANLGLSIFDDSKAHFNLLLDFHSNTRTATFTQVIDLLVSHFKDLNKNVRTTEIPLNLIVEDLKIEDIVTLIQDPGFQSINLMTSPLDSQWRVVLRKNTTV